MSIQGEITRIQGNVSNALDAIYAKGVTIPSGANSDDLANLIGQIQTGAGSAIIITDVEDEHGGINREVTAVSLAGDTVSPEVLQSGYTAHNALGQAIVGTASAGGSVSLQSKTNINPTESSQTITADAGYDGLSSVQINAIDSNFVGSGVARKSSSDLTASGATVTVPAGYYASQATKDVSSMTLPTAASGTSSGTSKATINISTSAQYINIPTGYNNTASYYTISATPNGSVTAPSSISGTSATVSTGTNTLTLTKSVSVTPNVITAGYISGGTAGNSSVSLTASVTTKAAATITPTKSAQTISSGTYLTGTQTIAAIPDAYQDVTQVDAAAGDVAVGKKIVNSSGTVVTGTLAFQTIYSGSSAPSSSLGSNGDIYLQTGA